MLSQRNRSPQYQAILVGAGQMGIEANGGLRDVEFAGQSAVELRIEHLLDLLVVAIDGEADQTSQNLQAGVQYMHDEVAAGGRRGHAGNGGTDIKTMPVDV